MTNSTPTFDARLRGYAVADTATRRRHGRRIEEQALQQLRQAPDMAGDPEFAQALRDHLTETEGHERRVRGLLEGRGASPSMLKDVVMRAGGVGFVLFAQSQTDTPGKLAAHALSYEAFEWASYDLLARVPTGPASPKSRRPPGRSATRSGR